MKNFLDDLNEMQKQAVLQTEGPLLIFAGAGTGKTRVITYRIAYLLTRGIPPENILAITFTNKAAEEMKTRVAKLCPVSGRGVWISTFHSFAARILRIEAEKIGLDKNFVIYDESDQKNLIKQCLKELSIDEKKYKVGALLEVISRAKDDLIDPGSYIIYTVATNDFLRQIVAKVYHLYQRKLAENNALDFGDLLLKLNDVLHNNQKIREKYQNRFKYILVDEYQDTNRAQYVLIKHLSAKYKNLCVVGDDDQAIYSWRGANIQNIMNFERDYPEAKVLKLEQNYRSTKNILDCAWRVIRNNVYRKDKKLWTDRKSGEEVKFFGFENELEEAKFVANEIKKLRQENDYSYKNFAVFYRTNAQSRVFEDAFRKERIPYNIVGTVRFYDRKEIKDILSYLRVIVNPGDSISLKRIINVPHRGIGENTVKKLEELAHRDSISLWEALYKSDKTSIKKFIELIETFIKEKNSLTAVELTKKILKETGYIEELEQEKTYQAKERIYNLKEFVSAIQEYAELNKNTDVESFLADVSLMSDIDTWNVDKPGADAVTLMTLHLAKGLEFDVVFITGLEEGLFPIGSSFTEENIEDLEEERRLCYVGMTRAKNYLYMTYSETRHLYGQLRWNLCSRFIREAKVEKEKIVTSKDAVIGTFRCGQKVKHSEFGVGRIIKVVGRADNLKLVVLFEQGGIKKLLAKYANLEYVPE